MSHLHYHDREKLQKLYDDAIKDGKKVITFEGDKLLVQYLKFVLEMFEKKSLNTK